MEPQPAFDKAANTGMRHFVNAMRFSIAGLRSAVRNESAFRQELIVLLLLSPIGAWISSTPREFIMLMSISILVLVVELLNSGIEAAIDRQGDEYHELAKLGKDYGSAAVMLALFAAGIVWLVMLLEKLGIVPA